MERAHASGFAGLVGLALTLAGACVFETGGIPTASGGSTGGGTPTSSAGTGGSTTAASSTGGASASSSSTGGGGTGGATSSAGASSSGGFMNGHACTDGSDCHTGFCSPQLLCCDKACTDGCQSCKGADTGQPSGTCADVTGGKDPNAACSVGTTGVCDGMDQCSCADGAQNFGETDVDCGGANCPQCAQGQKCKTAADCDTGNCANGVCCDQDCASMGPCYSCNAGPHWVGTCEAVIIGTQGACSGGHVCDANQSCVSTDGSHIANGQGCSTSSQCVSDNCTGSPKTCRAWQPTGGICNVGSNCQNGTCQADYTCN